MRPMTAPSAPIVWAMSSTRARARWRRCCGVCARARRRRRPPRDTARRRGSCAVPRCSPQPWMPPQAPRKWRTSARRHWKWAKASCARRAAGTPRSRRPGTARRAMSSLPPPAAAHAGCERCDCGCGGARRAGSSTRAASGAGRARQRRRRLARSSRRAETPRQRPAPHPTTCGAQVGRLSRRCLVRNVVWASPCGLGRLFWQGQDHDGWCDV